MNLFLTGFMQVFFVALNTYFISKSRFELVFICSFLISFIWSFNVKKVAFGSQKDRFIYSFGAASGGLIGLIIAKNLVK